MAKRSRADKPNDPLPSNPLYAQSGFAMADCMRAETKVSRLLRDVIRENRVTAEQVLLAMFPAMRGEKKIDVTEHAVRQAVKKVLDAE
jgi:hypothetical protein